jgi:DNA-3-methyladenine glycosylase I
MELLRCFGKTPGPMREYHDFEWGVPVADERKLFELLLLEGAQAGLSWELILRRREGYRRALDGFDMERIAQYDASRIGELLADPGIVRNRLKVQAAVSNARAALDLRESDGGLPRFLWSFVEGRPLSPRRRSIAEWPAHTPLSAKISKELQRRGFRFVGPTIVYSLMQAAGFVNDHPVDCFRHAEIEELGRGFTLDR